MSTPSSTTTSTSTLAATRTKRVFNGLLHHLAQASAVPTTIKSHSVVTSTSAPSSAFQESIDSAPIDVEQRIRNAKLLLQLKAKRRRYELLQRCLQVRATMQEVSQPAVSTPTSSYPPSLMITNLNDPSIPNLYWQPATTTQKIKLRMQQKAPSDAAIIVNPKDVVDIDKFDPSLEDWTDEDELLEKELLQQQRAAVTPTISATESSQPTRGLQPHDISKDNSPLPQRTDRPLSPLRHHDRHHHRRHSSSRSPSRSPSPRRYRRRKRSRSESVDEFGRIKRRR